MEIIFNNNISFYGKNKEEEIPLEVGSGLDKAHFLEQQVTKQEC